MGRELFQKKLYTVRIGKKEITEGVIREIDHALDKHGAVKVKMLRSFREATGADRREVAEEVARLVNARLVGVRGFTFILVREKRLKK